MSLGMLEELKTVEMRDRTARDIWTEPGHERGLGCRPSDLLQKGHTGIRESEGREVRSVPGLKSLPQGAGCASQDDSLPDRYQENLAASIHFAMLNRHLNHLSRA